MSPRSSTRNMIIRLLRAWGRTARREWGGRRPRAIGRGDGRGIYHGQNKSGGGNAGLSSYRLCLSQPPKLERDPNCGTHIGGLKLEDQNEDPSCGTQIGGSKRGPKIGLNLWDPFFRCYRNPLGRTYGTILDFIFWGSSRNRCEMVFQSVYRLLGPFRLFQFVRVSTTCRYWSD